MESFELVDENPTSVFGVGDLLNPESVGVPNTSEVERKIIGADDNSRASASGNAVPDAAAKARDIFLRSMADIERNVGCASASTGADATVSADADADAPVEADASAPVETDPIVPLGAASTRMTQEALKREHVIGALGANSIASAQMLSLESEKDEKMGMIEEIHSLISILRDDGVDVSEFSVPRPDESYEDILCTLKILRRRDDRMRLGAFADDTIMMAAKGIELLFDGKREWFGRHPDMVGWSNQVRPKLRRMRHETADIANNVVSAMGMGPLARVLLELVPNMVMYANRNTGTGETGGSTGSSGSATATASAEALNKLRNL